MSALGLREQDTGRRGEKENTGKAGGRDSRRAPCDKHGSEGVTQRELDEPGRSHGGKDLSERGARAGAHFDVVDSRVREVGMVPDVEKVGAEAERVALGEVEVLDQREVPVLL